MKACHSRKACGQFNLQDADLADFALSPLCNVSSEKLLKQHIRTIQSVVSKGRSHLWELLALRLEAIDLLCHAVDLLHNIYPKEFTIALDGADHIHIQPALDTPEFMPLTTCGTC